MLMYCCCIGHTLCGFGSHFVLCFYGSGDYDSCSYLCCFDGCDSGSGGSTRLLHRVFEKTILQLGRIIITAGRIIDNATASVTVKEERMKATSRAAKKW